ncbi:MAG TPA: replicative DNA helicase, partial [Candidatus Pacebacteria bacterium]|nr:replicative DNA helicase [Candidatus Paceibacterota bacterium]
MSDNQLAKLPPHDQVAERSVLAAILIDPEAIIKATEQLVPQSFYLKSHQMIFDAMIELFDGRQPIDAVTLTNQLKKKKHLSIVGGASAVAELSNIVSTAANVGHYAALVREYYVKRQLISLSAEMSDMAFDDSKKIADVLDLAEQKVLAVSQIHNTRSFIHIKNTLVESFDRLDELQRSGAEFRGIPTGFRDLDNLTAGL